MEREAAGGWNSYDLEYTYDAGGNRETKVDHLNDLLTEYHYDLEDPEEYESNNNRLMKYEVFNIASGAHTLLSTTWYYYNAGGNPERIVSKEASSGPYTSIRFGYAKNARTVMYIVGEQWDAAFACPPANYTVLFAREFRYDQARARYLSRKLNPASLEHTYTLISQEDVWSDFDADDIYADYSVINGTATQTASHEPGIWKSVASVDEYLHSDHLGTLRMTTSSTGTAGTHRVYTAFGERISGPATVDRYGYVGEEGYQSHIEIPFLHVGARYYDPASGRFLQRDPIGSGGGLNVYEYAGNDPVSFTDPDGLSIGKIIGKIVKGLSKGKKAPAKKSPPANKPTEKPQAKPQPKTPDWTKPPGPDYEWKGKGPPGSKGGSWVNPKTNDRWHPDPDHPLPEGPHWDRIDPSGKKWRVYPDGRCEPKP